MPFFFFFLILLPFWALIMHRLKEHLPQSIILKAENSRCLFSHKGKKFSMFLSLEIGSKSWVCHGVTKLPFRVVKFRMYLFLVDYGIGCLLVLFLKVVFNGFNDKLRGATLRMLARSYLNLNLLSGY